MAGFNLLVLQHDCEPALLQASLDDVQSTFALLSATDSIEKQE
jgi:hypothetical protein